MHWLFTGPLTIDRLTVKIADLPKYLHGIRLVQLSDFHYDGLRLSEELLTKAIAATNEAQPDIILLTGDYVTDNPTPIQQLALRLQDLKSRHGTYAVLGNHDIYYQHSRAEITSALTRAGIHVLWNQIAYPLGEDLPIIGLADYYSRDFNPAPIIDSVKYSTPRIVLSHNPDTAEILSQSRVDLQLSGHTHGGHIVLPKLGPVVVYYRHFVKRLPKKLQLREPSLLRKCSKVVNHWQWAQGLHQVANNQLYVNRGLGTYKPGRLFCPPEVTVIELTTA